MSTTSNNEPRGTQRNEIGNYEVDRIIHHTKMNVGGVQHPSAAVTVNYKTLSDSKPLPLNNGQIKQIEDLIHKAMDFSKRHDDSLSVINSPFNNSGKNDGGLLFWRQRAFTSRLLAVGRWLLVLLVAWLLWRKTMRLWLTRRAEAMEAVQQQAQAREEVEDTVEVRLSKNKRLQQRCANQRLGAEVVSQHIRKMSDSDPRVVTLVIRQWMDNDHEQPDRHQ